MQTSPDFCRGRQSRHLSRAAEALQADQSTVSRKVARLEQEVGVLLFERIGRTSASPRPDGGWWARRTHPRRPSRCHRRGRGAVAAESGGSASPSCTRSGLAGFRSGSRGSSRATRRSASPRGGTTAEVMSGVWAVLRTSASSGPATGVVDLEIHPLFRERVAVVVRSPPLVGRSSCTLEDVAGEPLILPRSRSGLRESSTLPSRLRDSPPASPMRATTSRSSGPGRGRPGDDPHADAASGADTGRGHPASRSTYRAYHGPAGIGDAPCLPPPTSSPAAHRRGK